MEACSHLLRMTKLLRLWAASTHNWDWKVIQKVNILFDLKPKIYKEPEKLAELNLEFETFLVISTRGIRYVFNWVEHFSRY